MTNHAVSNRADLRELTKTMSRHGDRRGQIADFRDSFETINWLYLLFKCGIKTKTHFEWLLWHWSSLGQLNLEPTRPNGLVGCKVPTDLVKISVKEATHMGFHYNIPRAQQLHCAVYTKKMIFYLLHKWSLHNETSGNQHVKYSYSSKFEGSTFKNVLKNVGNVKIDHWVITCFLNGLQFQFLDVSKILPQTKKCVLKLKSDKKVILELSHWQCLLNECN